MGEPFGVGIAAQSNVPSVCRLAVVSDLHCHLASQVPQESFLTVGALRRPRSQHPVESLLFLAETDPRAANIGVLVAPGDFTNKIGLEGFSQAWAYVLEV